MSVLICYASVPSSNASVKNGVPVSCPVLAWLPTLMTTWYQLLAWALEMETTNAEQL